MALDPLRGVIDRLVLIRQLATEQGVDAAKPLVRQSDDGFFMALPHRQGHELSAPGAVTAGSGLGHFTEPSPHPGMALAGFAAVACPGALMVARTAADPRSQPLGAAEWAHIGPALIDARYPGLLLQLLGYRLSKAGSGYPADRLFQPILQPEADENGRIHGEPSRVPP